MNQHVAAALFVYTEDTAKHVRPVQDNSLGVHVTCVEFDILMQKPREWLEGVDHVVIAGSYDVIKTIIKLSTKFPFSMGIIPSEGQKDLIRFYDLPQNTSEAIELAFQKNGQPVDLVLCNGIIVLFKATVGRVPLLDTKTGESWKTTFSSVLNELFQLKLCGFQFSTAGGQQFDTAATGCVIIQNHTGISAFKLTARDYSISDGMVSMVISAPLSIVDYFRLLIQSLLSSKKFKALPKSIGVVNTAKAQIQSEFPLDVWIDDQNKTLTPLQCEVVPKAIRVNIGKSLATEVEKTAEVQEKIDISNLPSKNELLKAKRHRRIPFFSYASSDRFRDLLSGLREDASINLIYIVLMVLSSMLAATGLYLDSTTVIIGAMLLAPLMAPIVSLAMGMLRGEIELLQKSTQKIIIGILIALSSSALITFLFPDKPVTDEMLARLHPTLLDLAVAVISGVAAAYSKSFREIIQSLAGVAIAVALVPPLVVAGIGIGRLDVDFFYQAFLLFGTNLIGIIIAATFTFRALGYSPALRSKKSFGIVLVFLALISIPLYFSYHRVVEDRVFAESWKHDRLFINGKYLIVKKANLSWQGKKRVILMDVFAREPLSRDDLNAFRKKIQDNFDEKLAIRINTIYIP